MSTTFDTTTLQNGPKTKAPIPTKQ